MPITITYDQPDFPDGYEFSLAGGVLVKNRVPTELSEDEELRMIQATRMTLADQFKGDNSSAKLSGTTSVNGGVKEAFGGINPNDEGVVSDTAPLDPTAMNLVDGEPFKDANLSGSSDLPDEDVVPQVKPVKVSTINVDKGVDE